MIQVRKARLSDKECWGMMRKRLWPDTHEDLTLDITNYFEGTCAHLSQVFILDDHDKPIGFIELNIRNIAAGSLANNVPYIEGWYVEIDHRSQGHGKKLILAAEQWALENGFSEIASDVEFENEISIQAHTALGYVETDRVVCFLKKLNDSKG